MSLTFVPVDADSIPKAITRSTSKSGDFFTGFLESDVAVAQVNLADQKIESVRSGLQNYIVRHDIPVRLFSRAGNLYMERLSPEQHVEYKAELADKSAKRAPRGSKKAAREAAGNGVATDVTAPEAETAPEVDEG